MTIIERVEAWQCNLCDTSYESEEGAASCCQAVSIVSVVKCPVCGDLCDSVDDICCTPERLEDQLSASMRLDFKTSIKRIRARMEVANTIDWENLTLGG
jgi:hypothetical protein